MAVWMPPPGLEFETSLLQVGWISGEGSSLGVEAMADGDYLDYIRPRGLPVLKATLRVIVAVQCFGAAAQTLSMDVESSIASFLLTDLSWAQEQVSQVDRYAAYGLLASGVLTLLRPCWPVLLPVSVWFAAGTLVGVVSDGGMPSILRAIEQSARVAAPLGLLLLDFWPPRLKSHLGRTVVTIWLLRLAIAATFAGHGLMALLHSLQGGGFLELLTVNCDKVFGWEMADTEARLVLAILGGIDLGLALNVIASRSRPIVAYMAFWGVATAASRVVLLGPQAYPEVLVRAAHGGIPLVLLLYWSLSIRQPPAEVVKAN